MSGDPIDVGKLAREIGEALESVERGEAQDFASGPDEARIVRLAEHVACFIQPVSDSLRAAQDDAETEAQQAKYALAEARGEMEVLRAAPEMARVYCAYCGYLSEPVTQESMRGRAVEHAESCEKHPLRIRLTAAEQEVERLRRNRQTADQHDCMLVEEARAYVEQENRKLREALRKVEWMNDGPMQQYCSACESPKDPHYPGKHFEGCSTAAALGLTPPAPPVAEEKP
jgi:hypothetical protein